LELDNLNLNLTSTRSFQSPDRATRAAFSPENHSSAISLICIDVISLAPASRCRGTWDFAYISFSYYLSLTDDCIVVCFCTSQGSGLRRATTQISRATHQRSTKPILQSQTLLVLLMSALPHGDTCPNLTSL
jgi:hypothetical protein